MDYKEETRKVYDRFSGYFDEKFGEYLDLVIKKEFDEATAYFPERARILDLGSGTGNHSLLFQQRSYKVLCLDNSIEMLKKCREKGLDCVLMDFESLGFQEKSFDVVWAYTSLLHIPKFSIPRAVDNIAAILKHQGLFAISFKEGNGEGFVEFKKGGKRWFSLYQDDEVRSLLKKNFQIIKFWSNHINRKGFLDYLCRKLS